MTEFDLFRTSSEGTEWVATFLDVEVAKVNAKSRATLAPGGYFVIDQCSGDKLFELETAEAAVPFTTPFSGLTTPITARHVPRSVRLRGGRMHSQQPTLPRSSTLSEEK
jgi:hypothetical protein